jgi:hypothetical protein
MMNSILPRIYRGDNTFDVATCKCHSHLHLVKDVEYYGDPMGFDASKGERNLKAWAKHISKTARKRGHATFIRQTANRVSDHQLIKTVEQSLSKHNAPVFPTIGVAARAAHNGPDENSMSTTVKWKYTRKKCHMRYDLQTKEAALDDGTTSYGNAGCHKLLTPHVKQVLDALHGDVGFLSIWKEIRVDLVGCGGGYHYVRAFHDFDACGHFFDWIHLVTDGHQASSYRPAKVLLLYCFQDQHYALVWKARAATRAELDQETNLSARWKMDLQENGLPLLVSVPIDHIEKCILVYEHWHCRGGNHLPTTEIAPGLDRSMFVIDEAYERSSWALNFIDDERWQEE